VYAVDVPWVASFYEMVAGLARTTTEPGYVILESPGFELAVVEIPAHLAQEIALATPAVRREDTPVKLAFFVPSIAHAREVASTLGGVIDPVDREWSFQGNLVCDGNDPEGNVLQLRQPLEVGDGGPA